MTGRERKRRNRQRLALAASVSRARSLRGGLREFGPAWLCETLGDHEPEGRMVVGRNGRELRGSCPRCGVWAIAKPSGRLILGP